MMTGDELGQVKEGYPRRPAAGRRRPAGQPGAILRDPKRILAVMKDGVFAKAPEIAAERAGG